MSDALKKAIHKVKIDGVLQQIAAITTVDAVAIILNPDGTVKWSLEDELKTFATALAEKATSTKVTEDIQTACQDLYHKILGKTDDTTTIDEAYDTLKEIADWLTGHGEAATVLTNDVSALKTAVGDLMKQIESLSGAKGVEIEESETNGNIVVDGKEIEVYKNFGKNVFVAKTKTEEAITEQKMEDGDMLFCIVQDTIELKNTSEEIRIANGLLYAPKYDSFRLDINASKNADDVVSAIGTANITMFGIPDVSKVEGNLIVYIPEEYATITNTASALGETFTLTYTVPNGSGYYRLSDVASEYIKSLFTGSRKGYDVNGNYISGGAGEYYYISITYGDTNGSALNAIFDGDEEYLGETYQVSIS